MSSISWCHGGFMPLQKEQWVPDEHRSKCQLCAAPFSFFTRRRHHCRGCGDVYCGHCSSFRLLVPSQLFSSRGRTQSTPPISQSNSHKSHSHAESSLTADDGVAVRVCKGCFDSFAIRKKGQQVTIHSAKRGSITRPAHTEDDNIDDDNVDEMDTAVPIAQRAASKLRKQLTSGQFKQRRGSSTDTSPQQIRNRREGQRSLSVSSPQPSHNTLKTKEKETTTTDKTQSSLFQKIKHVFFLCMNSLHFLFRLVFYTSIFLSSLFVLLFILRLFDQNLLLGLDTALYSCMYDQWHSEDLLQYRSKLWTTGKQVLTQALQNISLFNLYKLIQRGHKVTIAATLLIGFLLAFFMIYILQKLVKLLSFVLSTFYYILTCGCCRKTNKESSTHVDPNDHLDEAHPNASIASSDNSAVPDVKSLPHASTPISPAKVKPNASSSSSSSSTLSSTSSSSLTSPNKLPTFSSPASKTKTNSNMTSTLPPLPPLPKTSAANSSISSSKTPSQRSASVIVSTRTATSNNNIKQADAVSQNVSAASSTTSFDPRSLSPKDAEIYNLAYGGVSTIWSYVCTPSSGQPTYQWMNKKGGRDVSVYAMEAPHPVTGKMRKVWKAHAVVAEQPHTILALFNDIEPSPKWNKACLFNRPIHTFPGGRVTYCVSASACAGAISSRDFVDVQTWCRGGHEMKSPHLVMGGVACPPRLWNIEKKEEYTRGENGPSGFVLLAVDPITGKRIHSTSNQVNINLSTTSDCHSPPHPSFIPPPPFPPLPCWTEVVWVLDSDLKGWLPRSLVDASLETVMVEFMVNVRNTLDKMRKENRLPVLQPEVCSLLNLNNPKTQ